ncbi:MAG: hypothetical protein ACK52I_12715 [Pseudomonadota bacterium]
MNDYSIKDHIAYSVGFRDGKESQANTIAGLQAAVIQCRSLTELLKPQADRIAELEDALAKQDEYKAALQFISGWFPTNISQPGKQVLEMKEFAFNVLRGKTTTQAEVGRRKGASNE